MQSRCFRNAPPSQPSLIAPEEPLKTHRFTQSISDSNIKMGNLTIKNRPAKSFIPIKNPPQPVQQLKSALDFSRVGSNYPKCMSNDFARNANSFKSFPGQTSTIQLQPKINTISNLPISQSLYLLESVLQGCSQAKKMFGWTNYQPEYFYISENGKIFTDFGQLAKSKDKVTNENYIVQKIMNDTTKFSSPKFQDFNTYYQRNLLKQSIDFKYAASLIKSYMTCSKIKPVFAISYNHSEIKDAPMIFSRVQSKIRSSRKQSGEQERLPPPSEKSEKLRKSNSFEKKKFWHKTVNGLISPKILYSNPSINNQFAITLNGNNSKIKESLLSSKTKDSRQSVKQDPEETPRKFHIQAMLKSIHLNTKQSSSNCPFQNLKTQTKRQSLDQNLDENMQQKSIASPQKKKNEMVLPIRLQVPNLIHENILQVQSLGSFSDADISQYSSRSSEGTLQRTQRMMIKEKQQNILQQNQWIRTIDNLFQTKKQVQVSLILKSAKKNVSKQPQKVNENRQQRQILEVEEFAQENIPQ